MTAGTGLGLYVAPRSVGEEFAWEIRAPLTAAWMGAFYLTGASYALSLAALQRRWARARIVLVVANVLTWTSLVATLRFWEQFRLGEGTGLERVVAWTWLVVYIAIPVAALAAFVRQERTGGWREYDIQEPLLWPTRTLLALLAGTGLALGTWLSAVPDTLAAAWPWTLPDLSASILGTWFFTVGIGCVWALREGDWLRSRIVLFPFLATCVLHLVSLARLEETLTGSDAAVALYGAALGASVCGLAACAWLQRRAHLAWAAAAERA